MINAKLFSMLQNAYGDVKVLRPGVAMSCYYRNDPITGKVRLKTRLQGQGEEYRLDCPRCGDERGRLYINHRWGVYDKETKTRNLWLANCHNEGCYSEYSNQVILYDYVYGSYSSELDDLSAASETAKPVRVQEVEFPGTLWPLADILKRQPNHHALKYLRDRLISPEQVAETYDLSYCMATHLPMAENRIIVPMKQSGKLVGWQGRYVGETPSKDCPKYYTGPGTALNLLWYNSDVAMTYYTKVIVEGCTDVWMVGPQGMAIFNKKIGDERLMTMSRLVNRMEEAGNFVLLLDPDQNPKDADRGQEHHMEMVYKLFCRRFPNRVLKVYLPTRTDPGSLDRGYTWAVIRKVAAEHNFEISDRRIKRKEKGTWSPRSKRSRPISTKTDRSGP